MSSILTEEKLTPGVLSMLPIFYVGWSDSVLSPTEIDYIHSLIKKADWLEAKEKEYLIKYSDPKSPPSEETFRSWLKAIEEITPSLPEKSYKNVAQLGADIARVAHQSYQQNVWSDEATQSSLREVSKALGVNNTHSGRILMDQLGLTDEDATDSDAELVSALKGLLDGDYAELRTKLRNLLSDPLFKTDYYPEKESYRQLTLRRVKALADQGVSAFSFPKKYGGGEQKGDHIVVFEELSYSDLSLTVKFGVQFGLFGGAVFLLGTERHHRQYLEAMHRAELLGCFAMTETGHGSDVKGLKTTATYDHESRSITVHSPSYDAGKEYIGNALHSEMAAVFAQLIVNGENHGVHAVLVPIRKEGKVLKGVKIEDCGYKIGLNGVDNGRIWFDNVKVPVDNLLDKYGTITATGQYESIIEKPSKRFFTMLGALVVGRICVGLASVNATKKALHIATKYALMRRQFASKDGAKETLIMDYPTHQARLIPNVAKTYAYYFALRDVADRYVNDEGDDTRQIETLAAGLKSKASWHATKTIQICREACGGKGYLIENQIGMLKADSDIFTTFEGDNTVLMQLVAKGLLTEFRQSFHDDGIKAVIGYVLRKMKHTLKSYNPINKRSTDSQYLTSDDYFSALFELRYQKTLISLSERMRKYLSRRMDPYQAFLRTQLHMVDLADAYIDTVCLSSLLSKKEQIKNPALKDELSNIIQQYALEVIIDNKDWYLEKDFMEGSQAKALRRIRNKKLLDNRERVNIWVDAFAIPDAIVNAPIADREFS